MKLLLRVYHSVREVWGPFPDNAAALAKRSWLIAQKPLAYSGPDFAIVDLDHPEGTWLPPREKRSTDERLDNAMASIDAVGELAKQHRRLSMTAPVDDDFPEAKHAFDRALDAAVKAAIRANGPEWWGRMIGQAL